MTIDQQLNDATTNGIHDILWETKEHVRKIHEWVRLFGVLMLIGMALAFYGVFSASQDARSSSGSGLSRSYISCMADPNTTAGECALLR